jgi:hypothetical protein
VYLNAGAPVVGQLRGYPDTEFPRDGTKFCFIFPGRVVTDTKEIVRRPGAIARADLKIGICGEHGGDPASVEFCNEVGLDYVSCSPYRLPIARLAAAQAALKQ